MDSLATMKYHFSALAMAFGCHTAAAQQTPKLPPMERVLYRPVAFGVLKQMPEGAKSCFYGSFKLRSSGPILAAHLFDPNPKHPALRYDGKSTNCHFKLQIFNLGATTHRAKHAPRLARELSVDYIGSVEKPVKFGAYLTWLDPATKKRPILKFNCFDPNGFAGLVGDEVLLVFPSGIHGKTHAQGFVYGSWHASNSSGQANEFKDVDEKGLLRIHSYTFPTGEAPAPSPVIYQWDGEAFAPVDKNAKNDLPVEP